MFKIVAPLALCIALATSACSSTNYNKDEVPDVSPATLYSTARAAMSAGNLGEARQYLEAIDSRYPFGQLSEQVQLDLIYVYYKSRESDLTSAQIKRYLRLSPTSQYADYVTYMKGLNEIQKRSDIIQDFFGLDRSQKDPTNYLAAFKTFKGLIETYPDSPYVPDARQRMIFIKNEMAKRELLIAKYYNERGAYLSSIRHCQNVLYAYRGTPHLKEALELMVENYNNLNLPEAANNTKAVLAASFDGKNYIYTKDPSQIQRLNKGSDEPWYKKLDVFDLFG
ncbi:outer membrane biogenesis protein BamD [Anaerobiospirillum thomasii]|uniref:Outer membrane protein assembly factor BamD n=2 Tax=Gammaproteobacteria TaxID=1236 RepID=A0A2X0V6S9_9GAMM|nr:outer membrane protein assembly factor BamD [Anaerobiospirillum thomasii]SPT68632.1 outer membrane biogenesis protein BamD [Anaerobiospirillum thomasii]SPT68816.1 outer membrane biogenesis protein BamD [Anaerobiospirillum thomasii]